MSLQKFSSVILCCSLVLVGSGCTSRKSPDYYINRQAKRAGLDAMGSASAARAATNKALALNQVPDRVFFAYDSAKISPESAAAIERIARYIVCDGAKDKLRKVAISGHADERGTVAYNLVLGRQRADNALQELRTHGIPASIELEAVSYGKSKPVALESNEEAWKQNRRVEFDFYGQDEDPSKLVNIKDA